MQLQKQSEKLSGTLPLLVKTYWITALSSHYLLFFKNKIQTKWCQVSVMYDRSSQYLLSEGTVNFTGSSQLHTFPSIKEDRFSLTNNFTLSWKHNFALSIFFSSCFLSRIRLQNFLFTNLTILVFGLPLPFLWHPSISLFSTVRLIDLHISSTLCSRCAFDTVARIPSISMLFLLVYWSWCIGH